MLETGKFDTVLKLSQALKIDRSPLAKTLSLVNLAPDIVQTVFDGTAPSDLTLAKLFRSFPDDWQEQKKAFGME